MKQQSFEFARCAWYGQTPIGGRELRAWQAKIEQKARRLHIASLPPEQRKKAQDTENSTGQLLVTTGRVGANADECQTHITTDTEHSNMECSCNVGIDGDNDDFLGYSERTLKAGRKHTCVECGKEIKKGEQFVFISIFEIERIGNFKLCLDCHAVSKQFFADGWIFGQMWDNLGDYLFYNWKDDLPSNCISKLPPPARDRVCDQLQDFQEAAI